MDRDDQTPGEGFLSRFSGRSRRDDVVPPAREAGTSLPFAPDALLEALPDGAATATPGGMITWANPALAEMLGQSAESLVGQSLAMIAGPYANEREGLQLLEMVREGQSELETTAISRDGTSFPCLVRARLMNDAGRELRLVLVSEMAQISAMRAELAAKAELQQRERSILENVARSLQDGLVVLDDTERVVLANASAESLLGLSSGAQRGRALVELPLPGPLRGEWLAFLASNEASNTQTLNLSAGGRRRVLLLQFGRAAAPSGAPVGSVLLVRDLSALGRAGRARTSAMRDLIHELRTPMQTIRGFAETLAADGELPAETRREFCRTIEEETRRLGRAIETLLAMAGRGPVSEIVERRTQDARPVVAEGVERAREALGRPASSVRLAVPDAALSGWIDAARLSRAVQEITANALLHGHSDSGVEVRLRQQDEALSIEVRDWGRGIAPEELEIVFDPFFRLSAESRAEPSGKALAYGLPFCREVAEAHGGAIRAELPRGGGLRILLEFPAGRR